MDAESPRVRLKGSVEHVLDVLQGRGLVAPAIVEEEDKGGRVGLPGGRDSVALLEAIGNVMEEERLGGAEEVDRDGADLSR